MRLYELVLVFRSKLSESERKTLLDTVKSWFSESKMVSEKELGLKTLAYKIKNEARGFYSHMVFEAPSIAKDVEKRIINQENILRHLLVRKK